MAEVRRDLVKEAKLTEVDIFPNVLADSFLGPLLARPRGLEGDQHEGGPAIERHGG